MKQTTKRLARATAFVAGLVLAANSALADVNLTTFENVNVSNLGPYGSWTTANMADGSTGLDLTSPGGFGGVYFPFSSTINATGTSNIVLTVDWTNSTASSSEGFIIVLGDIHTTQLGYQFYGLPTGRYVVSKAIYPPDFSPGTLDLSNITYVHLQGDGSAPYSIQWQNLALAGAMTNVEVLTFDNYHQNAVYGAWASGATTSVGPTNWTVTAIGGGSDWVYLGGPDGVCNGAGQSNIVLTVTVSGVGAGEIINPFVELIDSDSSDYTYTWYNLTNGQYSLTMPVQSPTTINAAGSTPGLNLAKLQHSHIGVDTGGQPTQYTISFDDLSLATPVVSAPTIQITSQSYNPQTHQLTLTWTSSPTKSYTILSTSNLQTPMSPLSANISSGGATTTTTVTLPVGNSGFVKVEQQP